MLGTEFDWFIGLICVFCGILILTGHGDFIMKGGNAQARREHYDEKKMVVPTGIAFLLIGGLTILNIYMTTTWAHVVYLILMVAVFAGLIVYYQMKCRK